MTERNNANNIGSNGSNGVENSMRENAVDHLAVMSLGGLTVEEEREIELLIADDPELAMELQAFGEIVDELPYFPEPMEVSKKVEDMLFRRVEANAQARFKISPSTTQIFKARIPQKVDQPVSTSNWLESLIKRPIFATSLAAAALVFSGVIWLQGVRISSINSAQAEIEAQLNESVAAQQSLTNEIADLEQELDEANGFVDAYKSQLTDTLVENAILKETAAAAELSRDEIATQVASLVDNNSVLSDRNVSLEEKVAYQDQIIGLFGSDSTRTIEIGGTEQNPGAAATIVFNPEQELAILVVNDLPQLEGDEVYQVLLIRGNEHDTAETFRVNTGGENILIVESPQPMSIFDTVGVSIEPNGGSVQRTGDIVLLGELTG